MKKQGSISSLLKRSIAGIAPASVNAPRIQKTENMREAFTKALMKKKKK